jgi:acyl carrier protein
MHNLTSKIIAIVATYSANTQVRVGLSTTLSELNIDRLDLPMIFLDVEEACGVQIDYHEDIEDLLTVGGLVSCVASSMEAAAAEARIRKSAPRKRSTWVSTRAA